MSETSAKESMRTLATKAQEVVKDETKTFAERREALDKIEVEIKGFADEIATFEQARRLAGAAESAPEAKSVEPETPRSLGGQVTSSPQFKAFATAMENRERSSATIELKAVNTVGEGTTFSGGFPTGQGGAAVIADFLPGIVDLRFRKLLIADLFAQGATSSNQVSWVQETAFQNGAAGTTEAAAYAQTDDTIARKTAQVGKIAHYLKDTDELVQDAEAYQSFLQNRLVFGVRLKEDGELLNGTGYPSVTGVLQTTGLQTAIASEATGTLSDPTLVMDDIYEQITAIRFTGFVEPDAIVMNPADWQHLRLAKDANKQYYNGGPFTGAYGNGGYTNVDALWGLRVVLTAAITSGTTLIGGFQECAQIFRRQGITVEMTNSNSTDFENGLITVRAEERLALAVFRPGGFGTTTITWA